MTFVPWNTNMRNTIAKILMAHWTIAKSKYRSERSPVVDKYADCLLMLGSYHSKPKPITIGRDLAGYTQKQPALWGFAHALFVIHGRDIFQVIVRIAALYLR